MFIDFIVHMRTRGSASGTHQGNGLTLFNNVAGGDKVPRKGGPGVSTADLLVINKVDLAPFVGADMDVMVGDAHNMRSGLPVIVQSLKEDPNAHAVAIWVREELARWVDES